MTDRSIRSVASGVSSIRLWWLAVRSWLGGPRSDRSGVARPDWAARIVLWLALGAVALVPGKALRAPFSSSSELAEVPLVVIPQERGGKLAIRVTADEQPVANAHVAAYFTSDEGSALVEETETDDQGKAALGKLPRGVHWIVIDAVGHARGGTSIAIDDSNVDETPVRELVFPLTTEHMLDVRIRDEAGNLVHGAEVEALGGGPLPAGALTDDQGLAHLRRLGAGPFAVTARAPGLEETTRTGVAEGSVFELVLRKLGKVAVHVLDERGEGASNARVEITGGGLGRTRSAETDRDGDVTIASLAAGAYALRAVRGGSVSATELDVRLAAGEDRTLTLRLQPGMMVAVRAVSEEVTGDVPIAGAGVVLAEGGLSPFPLEGLADASGRTRLGPIPRGPATVSVSAPAFVSQNGVPVREPDQELRIVLSRAGVIEGRVVDGRGYPIGGATLVVVGTDPNGGPIDEDPRRARVRQDFFASALGGPAPLLARGELGVVPGPVPGIPRLMPGLGAPGNAAGSGPFAASLSASGTLPPEPWTTRGDGTFRLTGVPPGRVHVLARHPQYVESTSDMVSLEPAGHAEVSIVLREGSALEGTVVDARGRTEAGVRVSALATRGLVERATRTGDDGHFAFASLPDSVTLLVEASGGRSARLTIDLKDGERREIRIALPEPREPILVHVRDDRGYAVDAVQLSVGSLDPSAPTRITAFTDARGDATLAGVRGLPLRVTATHPGHATKSFSIDANANANELSIVLARGQTVLGEIRGRRDGPLIGATVVASGDAGSSRSMTGARGEFRIDGLAPGSVKLTVRAADHAPLERTLTLETGRDLDLGALELADECAIEGQVVDESGKPVAGARVGKGHVPTWLPVGPLPAGLVQTDVRGAFHLGELTEGVYELEAYTPDFGRGRVSGIRASPGRATSGVRIVLIRDRDRDVAAQGGRAPVNGDGNTSGNVAVTLGVTEDNGIVFTDVIDGSSAERAGLVEGDRLIAVDGAPVHSMDEARSRLAGPVQDDVVVSVERNERTITVRVPREAARR